MAKKKSKTKSPRAEKRSAPGGHLGWDDYVEIAFLLIDLHPRSNPKSISADALAAQIRELEAFGDETEPTAEQLEQIADRWHEERMEMEEELGPVVDESEEDLDEDDYREDRMVGEIDDEESQMVGLEEYEKEDEEDEINPDY